MDSDTKNMLNMLNEDEINNNYKLCKDTNHVRAKNIKMKKALKVLTGIGVVFICGTVFLNNSGKSSAEKNEVISDEDSKIVSEFINEEENKIVVNDKNEVVIQDDKENKLLFDIGSDEYGINYIREYMDNKYYEYFLKYSKDYGVDPNLMIAICMQESGLQHFACCTNGERYNGCAVGISQQENPSGREFTGYNYSTGNYDTVACTLENAENYEINVKLACIQFQNSLKNYNGNVYMAIQAHNYGETRMNQILKIYSEQTGKSIEDIKIDYNDLGWLNIVDDVHCNPTKYVENWEYHTYGDNKYIEHVLRYALDEKVNLKINDASYTINLSNGTLCEPDKVR